MTDTTKSLTADEIAHIKKRWAVYPDYDAPRLIATIEQRDEQIGKLRKVLSDALTLLAPRGWADVTKTFSKVLVATEKQP